MRLLRYARNDICVFGLIYYTKHPTNNQLAILHTLCNDYAHINVVAAKFKIMLTTLTLRECRILCHPRKSNISFLPNKTREQSLNPQAALLFFIV